MRDRKGIDGGHCDESETREIEARRPFPFNRLDCARERVTRYSPRSATTGSTRAARLAGSQLASAATTSSTAGAAR